MLEEGAFQGQLLFQECFLNRMQGKEEPLLKETGALLETAKGMQREAKEKGVITVLITVMKAVMAALMTMVKIAMGIIPFFYLLCVT